MESRFLAMKHASEAKLAAICAKLEETLPQMTEKAGNVGSKLLQDTIDDLNRVRCEMRNLVCSPSEEQEKQQSLDESDSGLGSLHEVSLDDVETPTENIDDEFTKNDGNKKKKFFNDTVLRIRSRLDEMYKSDPENSAVDRNCDIEEVARLINDGKNDDALRLIIKNSNDVEDVLKLSAAALDRAGGVSSHVKDEIRRVDYVSMCTKYATAARKKNHAVTNFVDNILYEGLLDGKIYPSDFSNKYEPLEELQAAIDGDHETTNENARRFLALLTKTLLPATSVILKVTAVITLLAACATPLTAGLMCASAFALDTVTQILKSRFMCDCLTTFMATADSGHLLNETLSKNLVKKITKVLLNEVVTGSIKVCHVLSGGNLCK